MESAVNDGASADHQSPRSDRSTQRPYSLQSLIEFVAGPAPAQHQEVAGSTYRLAVQGMYSKIAVSERVAIVDGQGNPVYKMHEVRDENGEVVLVDGEPAMKSVQRFVFERRPINRRWWIRRAQSGLTATEADRLACAIGVHPSLIWTSWFEDGMASSEQLTPSDWTRIERNNRRRARSLRGAMGRRTVIGVVGLT